MGHHYTPQAHLRRFAIEGNLEIIWSYDKTSGKFKDLPISKVAQERKYYPADVEEELNNSVELPSGACIQKLLNGVDLDEQERHSMAVYLFTMRSRGPRERKRAEDIGEQVWAETKKEMRRVITDIKGGLANDDVESHSQVDRMINEMNRLEQVWEKEPPARIENLVKTPFISPTIIETISKMTWEVLPVTESMYFITSDTPAHYFDWMGLSLAECEFTFTISHNCALIAHRRGQAYGINFHRRPILSQWTKEINRRIISTSERFVFSPKNESWIDVTAQKLSHRLNSIRFNR